MSQFIQLKLFSYKIKSHEFNSKSKHIMLLPSNPEPMYREVTPIASQARTDVTTLYRKEQMKRYHRTCLQEK